MADQERLFNAQPENGDGQLHPSPKSSQSGGPQLGCRSLREF
jgi:hypothetical protein